MDKSGLVTPMPLGEGRSSQQVHDAQKIDLIEPAACLEGSSIEVMDRSCQYSMQTAQVAAGSEGETNQETQQEQDPVKTRTTEGNENDQVVEDITQSDFDVNAEAEAMAMAAADAESEVGTDKNDNQI